MTDLAFVPAVEQARMVRDKEISPVELVDLYLARIEKYDDEINAYVTVAGDQARDQAVRAEQEVIDGGPLGPFHGVPIPIKDLFETQGIKTTFSCRALAELVPEQDDNVVVKIKQAGAIVIGKTNTSEFGSVPMTESQLNGVTRNPWDHDVTAGGSSGGAAAAVAAGLAPVAQGSDGGGSIRVPASCCGLFGLKPSRGRISAGPRLGEHWHGFSTSGALGHTVTDVAALIDVMSGYMTGDPYSAPTPSRPFAKEVGADPGKLRIGFTSKSPNEIEVHPDCLEALESAAKLLESLGHEVLEAEPASWVDQSLQPHFIQLISTGTAVLDFLPHDQLEPLNRYLVESARQIDSTTHIQALVAMHQWTRQICSWWDDFDILLTPTTAVPPVQNGWVFSDDDPFMALVRSGQFIPFTPPLNITGQPAASVPLHRNAQGLPIGIQIVGAPYREDLVLRLAGQLEEASPWAGNHPEMP